MKASDVKLSDLKTWLECFEAMEQIESDYRNIHGGMWAWDSGFETQFTASAQRKYDAIKRKRDRLADADDELDGE